MNKFDLGTRESRRSFLKKASYAAPVILTFNAVPAFASHGSTPRGDDDEGETPQPFDPRPDPIDTPPSGGRTSQTGFGG
jgi:hypothetical protein